MNIFINSYMYRYVCVCIKTMYCIHTLIYASVNLYLHISIHPRIYTCIRTHIQIYIFVYINIYIYTYIRIHTYIYTHIYVDTSYRCEYILYTHVHIYMNLRHACVNITNNMQHTSTQTQIFTYTCKYIIFVFTRTQFSYASINQSFFVLGLNSPRMPLCLSMRHTYISTSLHVNTPHICICVHSSLRSAKTQCVCACGCSYRYIYLYTYVYIYIHTRIHSYIRTYSKHKWLYFEKVPPCCRVLLKKTTP